MAHAQEVKTAVRGSYIYERMSLEQAAAKHDVPVATIRRWKSLAAAMGDDWDKARGAAALSTSGAGMIAQVVLTDFLTLHQATMAQLLDADDVAPLDKAEAISRLSDAFHKTMAAVARAAPDLGRYAVATELLQLLAVFVREKFPQHAEALAEVLEPFAGHVAERYG
ncbi:DUF1804 family protein [Inquilinus limosus]|uniref:DUF1804 family protein n=1 Tax=Inquilinus limosus TaxID=171674 RepID=UPI00040B4B9C|nr:DUF1804 family protein [Inquilinus limosus]